MIDELRVRNLGVIVDMDVVLAPGFTAITGETGAGKTLVVEALELVLGGRADVGLIRHGAAEAVIEARFIDADDQRIVSRIIARSGRSRATVDGHMVPVTSLAELGEELIDLYGQHAHQSLLRPAAQRHALDQFAGIDLSEVNASRAVLRRVESDLERTGGDAGARERELDIVGFELKEIDDAAIVDVNEELDLEREATLLSDVDALRRSSEDAYDALTGSEGTSAIDRIAAALSTLEPRDLLVSHVQRLRGVLAELEDAAMELRSDADRFEADPVRLDEIGERRAVLRRLVRKHGSSLADVLERRAQLAARYEELTAKDERRGELEAERKAAIEVLERAERTVGDCRRERAGELARAVAARFSELALERAKVRVEVPEEGIGDGIVFLLAANPGEPFAPLAKAASGGELARVMLALRLVLSSAPPTLIFDEVDAGIGGHAALAVGRALSALAREHQVLVVTHLAQVAAYADHHLVVEKGDDQGRTVANVHEVDGDSRLVELSRMLSGHPDSEVAKRHAAELLANAGGKR